MMKLETFEEMSKAYQLYTELNETIEKYEKLISDDKQERELVVGIGTPSTDGNHFMLGLSTHERIQQVSIEGLIVALKKERDALKHQLRGKFQLAV